MKMLDTLLRLAYVLLLSSLLCGTIMFCMACYEFRKEPLKIQCALTIVTIIIGACFLAALKEYLKEPTTHK